MAKKLFLTPYLLDSFFSQHGFTNIIQNGVISPSSFVKRCNKKNDLRSFWRITQRKYIFLQIKKEYMIMKRTLWFIFFLLNSLFYLYADSENDSLLKVLDKVISERLIYTQKKEATIKELKKKKEMRTLQESLKNLDQIIYFSLSPNILLKLFALH